MLIIHSGKPAVNKNFDRLSLHLSFFYVLDLRCLLLDNLAIGIQDFQDGLFGRQTIGLLSQRSVKGSDAIDQASCTTFEKDKEDIAPNSRGVRPLPHAIKKTNYTFAALDPKQRNSDSIGCEIYWLRTLLDEFHGARLEFHGGQA